MKFNVYTEGTMEDSYIFSTFNENKELTTKMIQYIKSAVDIDEDLLQEQILQIQKTKMSPLVDTVLGAFARGEIQLLYNKSVKVPSAVPYIVRRDPSFQGNVQHIRATVFISNFGFPSKDGKSFDIPSKKLYVLMEAAYVALFSFTHPNTLERNYGLMRVCCEMYTTMFTRLMNREFSLSLDEDLSNKVTFCISRFFLEKVWGSKNPQIIFNIATTSNIRTPNMAELSIVNTDYTNAEIKDISDLLLFIKTLSPRFSTLSVRYYIQRFILTYQGGAILSIDYLPYMFYVIIDSLLGGYLLNQKILSDIVKNQANIRSFYPELSKITM